MPWESSLGPCSLRFSGGGVVTGDGTFSLGVRAASPPLSFSRAFKGVTL